MSASTVTGRAVLSLLAIALASVLLRGQISSALVTRGDSLAYWGKAKEARAMYARALAFDGTNRTAVDRYVFSAAISAEPASMRDGVRTATGYLTRFPNDAALRMDRALCYQREGALDDAIGDFKRAAQIDRDPRALMFAALDERALHHAEQARALLKKAMGLDPNFMPARNALART